MPQVGVVGKGTFGPGVITGPGVPNILVEGSPISVIGDTIAPHGEAPHTTATVLTGSPTVFAGGRPISVQGISTAICGHKCTIGAVTVQAT
tara:strand:+ start:256 stop:528 length:273 start_codon:yes stop_codon:yes gene_type:complete